MIRKMLPCWVALLLVFLAYSNSFDGEFVYDSAVILSANDLVTGAAPAFEIFRRDYWYPLAESGYYRPLTLLSFRLQADLLAGRLDPPWFHAANLGLHLINTALLFAIVARLCGRAGVAFWAALIFGVHPVNVEAVTNLVGRADLMAGLGVLVCVWMYLRKRAESAAISAPWIVGLSLIYFLAMLSKEHAILMPAFLALADWTVLKRAGSGPLPFRVYGALGLTAILSWAWRATVFQDAGFAGGFSHIDPPLVAYTFPEKLLSVLNVAGRYLGLLVWPVGLSCEHTYAQITKMTFASTAAEWAWLALGFVSLAAVVIALLKHRGTAAFFYGWAVLALLPALAGVFLFGARLEERWMYLPAAGLAGMFATVLRPGASDSSVRERMIIPALAVACLLMSARTWLRNLDWRDGVTLATSARASSPGSCKAMFGVAAVWADVYRSDPERYRRPGSALDLYARPEYRRYLDKFLSFTSNPAIRGRSLLDRIINECRASVACEPGVVVSRDVLGFALSERAKSLDAADPARRADLEEAVSVLTRAVEIHEEHYRAMLNRPGMLGVWDDHIHIGTYQVIYLRLAAVYEELGSESMKTATLDRLHRVYPMLKRPERGRS